MEILAIIAPVITFLIGRYFRFQYIDALKAQNAELLYKMSNIATVQIVPNINPHPAADKEYIGIYPNNLIEPAHLTVEEYQKGVDRLKNNPEDKIKTL